MMRNFPLPSRRARTSCSVLALATVLVVGATPVTAQSFLATGTPTNGAATSITTGPTSTTIAVTAPQTVINWVPNDNATNNNVPIQFQNSGTTASFLGNGNFAVLNNIAVSDLSRVISMNGTINAGALGAAAAANGSIYFYSPSGFLLGGNSIINVGSLVLSASPITVNGAGNFIIGASNSVIFGQAPYAGASITTQAGSQINAASGDAYVAMIAPRVQHGGTIDVNGSAALIGAEAATINFSPDGLFDIQVTTGTTDANGVSATGNITGSASAGAGDARRAFLVAVPKNTALTMAIGSGADLGFDIAGAANVSGNAVILSAGHDIVDGEIGPISSAAGALANIDANAINATSSVRAVATNFAQFHSNAGQSSNFASDLTISAPGRVWVNADGAGGMLTVGRDLVATSNRVATAAGASATGGDASIFVGNGGSISISRDVTLIANGTGGSSSTAGVAGGDGIGGEAWIQAQTGGGTITIGRNASMTANGTGGSGLVAGANGGSGTGGSTLLRAFTGTNSTITIGGTAIGQALGTGGSSLGCVGCIGGTGTGGIASASADGTLSVSGMLRILADGIGGTGATGQGGTVTINSNAASTLTAGSLNASADGTGGNDAGAGAGNGFGGSATMGANGAGSSIAIANVVTTGNSNQTDLLSAEGYGGNTIGGGSGTGGTGTGGTLLIQGQAGATITLPDSPSLRIFGRGTGGRPNAAGTTGGLGQGGLFTLSLDNATLNAGFTTLSVIGIGGQNFFDSFTTNGGAGIGGTRNISVVNGSTLRTGVFAGTATGSGGFATGAGNGGNGTGGTATLLVDNSTANFMAGSFLNAQGNGGSGAFGGTATGGTVTVTVRNGGIINVADDLSRTLDFVLNADAIGGDFESAPGGQGGDAVAGTATLLLDGGTINLVGNMEVGAQAYGGDASVNGGIGGNATGGSAQVVASGANSAINGPGSLTVQTNAIGGYSPNGVAGNATSGDVSIIAQANAQLTVQAPLNVQSNATGGDGSVGGSATGGNVTISAITGGDLNFLAAGGMAVSANAIGGGAFGGDGGNADGGDIFIFASGVGSNIIIAGATDLSADGVGGSGNGGECFDCGGAGGDGTGGSVHLATLVGGTIGLQSSLDASASGFGGGGTGSNAGNGQGGRVEVESTAANATITVAGAASLDASGFGGDNGLGTGTGGLALVESFGATTALIDFQSDLELYAQGTGGDSFNSNGGNGRGGTALVQASAGSTIEVAGSAIVSTDAFGGYSYDFSDGVGGNATGGTSRIQTFGGTGAGGTIAIDGYADISADGYGGDSYSSIGGAGGNGLGGSAHLITTLGNVTVGAAGSGAGADVTADGTGGTSENGTGGNGTGGSFARIEAINGDITIEGFAGVSASGIGGDGLYGGNGLGSGTPITNESPGLGGAHIFAQNGDIVINGGAGVWATGSGGDGGGDFGYAGDYGGDGGNGTGGWASIHAANSNDGASSISIDNGFYETSGFAQVDVSGTGGDGGDGVGGNQGGNGGNGGTGRGGNGGITAGAGNGTVSIGVASVDARGTGGDGGEGGNGDGGAGGDGGDGGDGFGGRGTIGTQSGFAQSAAVNLGFGDYGLISIDSSAFGGVGGDGNSGATNGDGGNGGNATGGAVNLLVRGSRVDVDVATLAADATGGDAGFGYVPEVGTPGITGIGGNATVGGDGNGIAAIVTDRFTIPAQRGTLNAGSINGTAIATAGIGIPNGISQNLGGNGVTFRNADGYIGSLDFLIQLGPNPVNAGVDTISVIDGDVVVDGEFSFITSGNLSLFANNGDMQAGILTLTAGNFVVDPTALTDRGTYFADSATIITGNNFVTNADLSIGSSLVIDAPGLINANNFGIDGDLDLIAQGGGITANNLDVTGAIDLDAFGGISLNLVQAGFFRADAGTFLTSSDITSDSNIQINAGGNVTLGEVMAGQTADIDSNKAIRIIAGGSVLTGNILAIGGIDITALGSVTGGNVTTGDVLFADALGAIVFGNVSAGLVNPQAPVEPFSVGLISGTSIIVGNVDASLGIAFATPGTLTSGYLTTTTDVLGLVSGNMSIGNISAGDRVVLADYSMFTDAGGTIPTSDDVNPEDIFAAALVPTNGSITVGNVGAGSFQAAAGTTLTAGNILVDGGIELSSGGAMTLGLVDAGGSISLDGDAAILAGDVSAGDFVLANGGSITLGDVDASSLTLTTTTGDITTGDVFAFGDVRLTSGADMLVGNIDSGDDVALIAAGSISTLDIFAYDDVSADAGTTITTDDITGSTIDLFADGDVSTGNLLTRDLFNQIGVEQLVEGASITVQSGGDVDTGTIDSKDGVYVSAAGTIATATIDAQTFVELFAGSNITADNINAGGFIDIFSDSGLLDLENLDAGTQIDLESGGSLQFGDATADDFNFEIDGSATGGNIDAITRADGHADGAIVLENITVSGPPNEDDFSVGFTSFTSIAVENVDGFDRVGFATLGNLTTGNITAGSLVITLAGGDIVTGSITTDSGGQVYMADASMCGSGCGDDDSDVEVEVEAILALAPVPTGGSITIDGPVITSLFQAAAGDNLATVAITADTIDASAGDNATIDGLWSSPDVLLRSGDINITANGRIDGGTNGLITLNAVTTDGDILIGDGLTGTGYALSNAEFGRLSGGTIRIVSGGNGGDADTLVGDLTITGPLAGSNVESNDGGVEFITLQEDGAALDGTLRVVGDVVATGFGAGNYLGFYTQNFELDAATGSISLTGNAGALAGTLELYASRIHVAEGSLLDQLANNPQFAGYREALNKQAAVQRPDGVIRAANFDIEFGGSDIDGPYTLFVQNMGTTAVPAGFLLNAANIADDGEGDLAAGSIDMAINGQIIAEGSTLTGIAVRDLLVTEFGTELFVAGSTINGCVLVGPCAAPTPPKVDTPTRTDIQLTGNLGLGDGLFGNEGDIDDGESGDDGDRSSPISPPNPLFDSRPLVQSGDVDDPVSGAGNPSLYDLPGDDDEDEEEKKRKAKAKAKQGDGK